MCEDRAGNVNLQALYRPSHSCHVKPTYSVYQIEIFFGRLFRLYKWQLHIPVHVYTTVVICGLHRKASVTVCGPAMSAYTNSVWLKLIFSHAVHQH